MSDRAGQKESNSENVAGINLSIWKIAETRLEFKLSYQRGMAEWGGRFGRNVKRMFGKVVFLTPVKRHPDILIISP
jgi:hypothetical protein